MQIGFVCILLVSIFVFIFGIACARPPAPIWLDLVSFRGSFCGHFASLLVLLQYCRTATRFKRKPSFGGAGPSFLHNVRNLLEVFWGVAVKVAFWGNFCRFGPPKGFVFESMQIFHEKKRDEIEARQLMTFGAMQILQN